MTNQEIFELMARFDASTATTLKLSTKDFSLELGKGGPAAPIPAAARCPPPRPLCRRRLLQRLRASASPPPWWAPSTPPLPPMLLPLCRWATM